LQFAGEVRAVADMPSSPAPRHAPKVTSGRRRRRRRSSQVMMFWIANFAVVACTLFVGCTVAMHVLLEGWSPFPNLWFSDTGT
jgi:hypothetical protein